MSNYDKSLWCDDTEEELKPASFFLIHKYQFFCFYQPDLDNACQKQD